MRHLLRYNTERPHWSLKMRPPIQFIQDNFPHPQCNMYVADTEELLDPEQFNVGLMRHLTLAQHTATSLVP